MNGVAGALISDLAVLMDDARQLETIRKEWAKLYNGTTWSEEYLSEAQMRAKRNRFRKSWPELADLLDKATKADVMDGVVKE